MKKSLKGIVLMGPFGSGKTYLGHQLDQAGVGRYVEMEPIIYDLFDHEDGFDLPGATAHLREAYVERLEKENTVQLFESTGVAQRPLILELIDRYQIGLIWVKTPKEICLERVAKRNHRTKRPIDPSNASDFFDYWVNEIAPTYEFLRRIDGTEKLKAIEQIKQLLDE